jgi:predicted porin
LLLLGRGVEKRVVCGDALAAVAVSTGAMAQATISGTFDPSYSSVKTTGKDAVKTLADSQQGTSGISFRGTEDLGGGLKANFRYEANFDATEGSGTSGKGAALVPGEVFVGLQGGFGSVQIGRPNSHTLAAQSARHAFGTKVGGGFGTTTGTLNVRNNDSIKYTSPTFNGFTVGFTHALSVAKVDAVPATAATATAVETLGSNAVPAKKGWNEVGVFYAAGPLNVAFTNVSQSQTIAQNNLAVSYNLGVARVFAGYHTEDDKKNAANSKKKGHNIGVSAPMGAVTLMANFGKLDVAGGRTDDRKITAVGARYDLSKRTNVYVRYVTDKTNKAASADDTTTKTTLVGLQHNF